MFTLCETLAWQPIIHRKCKHPNNDVDWLSPCNSVIVVRSILSNTAYSLFRGVISDLFYFITRPLFHNLEKRIAMLYRTTNYYQLGIAPNSLKKSISGAHQYKRVDRSSESINKSSYHQIDRYAMELWCIGKVVMVFLNDGGI